jgi:gamma-glutamyltranspeptidase
MALTSAPFSWALPYAWPRKPLLARNVVCLDRTAHSVRTAAVHAGLSEPAIAHGRNGFLVSPTVAGQWAGQARELRSQPGFAEEFLPGGRAPAPGERFRLPEHAATLETIAATGGEAFYRGELAAAMEAHSTANGGAMPASGDGQAAGF